MTRILSAMLVLTMTPCLLSSVADAFYVSYESPRAYKPGERVDLSFNKLTSSVSLSSMDYSFMPLCLEAARVREKPSSLWDRAVQALHADAFWEGPPQLQLKMLETTYCQQFCSMNRNEFSLDENERHVTAVKRDFAYNMLVDGLPAAFVEEDANRIRRRYWGGIPMGRRGGNVELETQQYQGTTTNELFVHNHFHFQIIYKEASADEDNKSYYILRVSAQPFSIRQANETACLARSAQKKHTTYYEVDQVPPQPLFDEEVVFSYDVDWILETNNGLDVNNRWKVYLTNDDAVPVAIELAGVMLALFLNAVVWGVLVTWVLRDLSYKPLVQLVEGVEEEDALREIQMWPLSSRIFFPPSVAPRVFVVACGTGAQWLATIAFFVVSFRLGVINQSMGANLLTPVTIIYAACAPLGGFATGRLHRVFHGELLVALKLCVWTATVYPILGIIVMHFCYDVLPDAWAPTFNVVSRSLPIILVWIFAVVPLTVLGGYFGFQRGQIQDFPLSAGTGGYQDLALQETEGAENRKKTTADCCRRFHVPLVFLFGGLLPVLSGFVGYAYGVAGPVFVGYYSDSSAFVIADYVLFLTCSGGVAALIYYRQIREQNYQWWWASFFAAASSGLFTFFLSLSWLIFNASIGDIGGGGLFLYVLWFLFGSVGVGCVTGSVGVFTCIELNRRLYSVAMQRAE